MHFAGKHILSISDFTRADVEYLFQAADSMEPYASRRRMTKVLEGAILSNMFFEPSTRTRVSFGSAFNLLGGSVRETTEIGTSSLVKGESLHDMARVLSGYSDVIVMRHPMPGSVVEFAAASRAPVINGGDGNNEHPSQALLDVYTIDREMAARDRTIDGLRIALVGDLRYGRAVHSLCKVLSLFRDIEYRLISPPDLALPTEYTRPLEATGHQVYSTGSLEEGLAGADIVYVTRTQEERFPSPQEASRYRGLFRLNRLIYTKFCAPNTVIMHPLPRDQRLGAGELDPDLDANPNLAIFRQTDNGILIRMALFALILDVMGQIEHFSRPVCWYSTKRETSLRERR